MAAVEEPPYNAHYLQKKDIIEALQRHIHNFDWRDEQCVLDISCGIGEITHEILLPLLPNHATLIGWDESREKIEYCTKTRKDQRLSFNTIDIQYVDLFFSWKWEYFHKIFSFYCLRWLPNYRRSLVNMHALLKHNGDILLIFLTPDNPMYRAFERLKERYVWKRLLSNVAWFYHTPSSEPHIFIRKLLDEIGFTNIYCYLKSCSTNYPSWDAYMEMVEAVNPYLRGLSPNQTKECLKSIREFIKHDTQIMVDASTGEITVNYSIVVAVAKKGCKEEKEENK